jgi:ribonuclease VapC
MVVDTSALVAILQDEPERHVFNEAIESAESRLLSVANWVETSIVIEVRHGTAGLHLLDCFLDRGAIECVPVDLRQAKEARRAFSQFGKGRHPAGLNYGDCFAYALARVNGQPLLFKGDDFARTDIFPAVGSATR